MAARSWLSESGDALLTPSVRDTLQGIEEQMASDGLRVLAIARKYAHSLTDGEQRMTLLGLVGIMDPPRQEAAAAVRYVSAGRHYASDDYRRSSRHRHNRRSGARPSHAGDV